jgi:hypothetical protein
LDTNHNENTRKNFALLAMVALGIILVAIVGEAAKYIMPHEALYFLLVNKVYILAAAIFLLMLGIKWVNIGSVRNLIALFVLVLVGLVVLWQLDKIASGILWNGMYPSVYGRIPEKGITLFLQSLDVLGLVMGALGAFLVLLKVLDLTKDRLAGQGKSGQEQK